MPGDLPGDLPRPGVSENYSLRPVQAIINKFSPLLKVVALMRLWRPYKESCLAIYSKEVESIGPSQSQHLHLLSTNFQTDHWSLYHTSELSYTRAPVCLIKFFKFTMPCFKFFQLLCSYRASIEAPYILLNSSARRARAVACGHGASCTYTIHTYFGCKS